MSSLILFDHIPCILLLWWLMLKSLFCNLFMGFRHDGICNKRWWSNFIHCRVSFRREFFRFWPRGRSAFRTLVSSLCIRCGSYFLYLSARTIAYSAPCPGAWRGCWSTTSIQTTGKRASHCPRIMPPSINKHEWNSKLNIELVDMRLRTSGMS